MKRLVMLLCAWMLWASTASAEGAWVLWSTTMSYWSQAIEPAIVYPKVAIPSYAECRAQAIAERDSWPAAAATARRAR